MFGESVTCPMVPFSKEEEGRNDMGVSRGGGGESGKRTRRSNYDCCGFGGFSTTHLHFPD